MRRAWVPLAWTYLAGCFPHSCADPGAPVDIHLELADEHNYRLDSALVVERVEVQAASEFCVAWSALDVDVVGQPMAATEIDRVELSTYEMPIDDVLEALSAGALALGTADRLDQADPDGLTSACASSFGQPGRPSFDPTDPALFGEDPSRTWLLTARGPGVRSMVFVVPSTTSTDHEVVVTDATAVLRVDELDLAARPAALTTTGSEVYTLDWSRVNADVFGRPFDPLLNDRLDLAWYDPLRLVDLDDAVFAPATLADELYGMGVFGLTAVVLSEAVDAEGRPFPGFTDDGVWVVRIRSSMTFHPAPAFAAVIDPDPPD